MLIVGITTLGSSLIMANNSKSSVTNSTLSQSDNGFIPDYKPAPWYDIALIKYIRQNEVIKRLVEEHNNNLKSIINNTRTIENLKTQLQLSTAENLKTGVLTILVPLVVLETIETRKLLQSLVKTANITADTNEKLAQKIEKIEKTSFKVSISTQTAQKVLITVGIVTAALLAMFILKLF